MLRRKTVFIVGAGASHEVGLPLGADLVQEISSDINIQYEFGNRLSSGDGALAEALRKQVTPPDGSVKIYNDHLKACARLRSGLSQSPISIDTYLDTHAIDSEMVLVGKLAIALRILKAERNSRLKISEDSRDARIDFENINKTWFVKLQQLIFSNVRREEIQKVFSNVAFICFNYDRCIEHFLFHALKGYFHTSDEEAAACMRQLKIFHPYGDVAPLPWQGREGAVNFGAESFGNILAQAGDRIRLFTEQGGDQTIASTIQREIAEANQLVFLGFAFHEQNVQLLSTLKTKPNLRILGSALGISTVDLPAITAELHAKIGGKSDTPVILDRNWKCVNLFEDLHHILRQE